MAMFAPTLMSAIWRTVRKNVKTMSNGSGARTRSTRDGPELTLNRVLFFGAAVTLECLVTSSDGIDVTVTARGCSLGDIVTLSDSKTKSPIVVGILVDELVVFISLRESLDLFVVDTPDGTFTDDDSLWELSRSVFAGFICSLPVNFIFVIELVLLLFSLPSLSLSDNASSFGAT